MNYNLQPLSQKEAIAFVNEFHRHNGAPRGDVFRIGLNDSQNVIGLVMVGRPVARHNDDGYTLEVLRCCVLDGHKNACSKLYAAAWRCARNLGYTKLITYTLISETGTSLVAAGWRIIGQTQARPNGWNTPSRPRVKLDRYPTEQKTLWEIS
jgi:hypothetical protein